MQTQLVKPQRNDGLHCTYCGLAVTTEVKRSKTQRNDGLHCTYCGLAVTTEVKRSKT